MLHPHFFEMVEYVCARGSQLKIETNGHYLTPENCARLPTLGVKAVQVSLDGASRATFNRMRVRGEFDRAVEGIRNLRDAGVPIEINFSPTRFNIHEIGARRRPRATSWARTASIPAARCTRATPSRPGATSTSPDEQYEDVLRHAARQGGRVSRPHARAFPRGGTARGAALPPAAAGGAADRAAERARQAHQRAAVRLRRPAHADARRDLGELPARVAATRAWREFVDDLARDPRQARARCTNGSTSERAADRRAARARPAQRLCAWCRLVRYRFFLYAGLLPYLLGAAWAYAIGGRVRRARSSGAASAASCCASSASRRSTSTSTRAWARTASSIPADLPPISRRGVLDRRRGVRRRARRGRLPRRCASAGRSSRSRCSAALAAIFYEAPPIRWCLSRAGRDSSSRSRTARGWCSAASTCTRARSRGGALRRRSCPGCLIMALAVVNAIPDYHQDRLVGKRNLVVRLGRARARRGCTSVWRRRGSPWWSSASSPASSRRVPRGAARACRCSSRARARALRHVRHAARVRAGDPRHRRLLRGRRAAVHARASSCVR